MCRPFDRRRGAAGVCVALLLLALVACGGLPDPGSYSKPVSHALAPAADTRLARGIARAFPGLPAESGFHPLSTGMDAFVARMALVAAADRSLDVQYYIWHGDTSGVLLLKALLDAADRGVRVRLLLDDLDTRGRDELLAQLDAHPRISIRLYNPFGYRGSRALGFLGDARRLNHRMHNKSLTADNLATIVGGRNIGDEYFDARAHTRFADLDVLALGPVVGKVSEMFDRYWNSAEVVPVAAWPEWGGTDAGSLQATRSTLEALAAEYMGSAYVRATRASPRFSPLSLQRLDFHRGSATLVYDDPDKPRRPEVRGDTHLAPHLAPMFRGAERDVLVVSPYFVPGDALVAFFGDLVARGVRVRILTNSLASNDVGLVHAGYMRYREALLRAGVELYEFKPTPAELAQRDKRWTGSSAASLHAKTMAVDGRRLFVGSFNVDPRSVKLNTEMGVLIDNPALANMLAEGFDQAVAEQAYRLSLVDGELRWHDPTPGDDAGEYSREPLTTWWQRFAAGTLSFIVPEALL